MDDIEHEFKMEEEKYKLMVGRGEDDDSTKLPVVIGKVSYAWYKEIVERGKNCGSPALFFPIVISNYLCIKQVNGEIPIIVESGMFLLSHYIKRITHFYYFQK